MSREWPLRVADIIDACTAIQDYTAGMDFRGFQCDRKTRDAVIHNLEVIGEAAKKLPDDVRALAPDIPWRDICGMREMIAHEYFRVDDAIVWNAVEVEIPKLLTTLEALPEPDEGNA